jgi:hypothetical protein
MNVPNAIINVLVSKKSLQQFKDVVEAATGRTVTDPLKLLTAALQIDARSPEVYGEMVAESGILKKFDLPGVKKKKRK